MTPLPSCTSVKDAEGVTTADFLGNFNSFLDDEDSADADILKKMVVMARVNVQAPEILNDSLSVKIRDLLSRLVVYREDDPSNISNRVCPACATVIPRGFRYCKACNCELISTGKFIVHVDDEEPIVSDTARVTEEVRQAQREAKEDAERIDAEEDRPDTNEMSEDGPRTDRISLPMSTKTTWESFLTRPKRTKTQCISCKSKQYASTNPTRHRTSPLMLVSCFSKCGK